MQNPQEIFNRISENKEKIKDIRTMLEDVYMQDSNYQLLTEEVKQRKEKLKAIRTALNESYQSELDKLDALKTEIKTDKELLRDILLEWRITKDWVEAQMAIVEVRMASLEQVFLPYIIAKQGQTVYEVWREQQGLLEAPKN